MAFLFEQMDVYRLALDWVVIVEDILITLKGRVSVSLLDQLSRASTSIPLNIAEGNGRWHKGDRKQFFWIARGSVFECLPIIQVLNQKNMFQEKEYQSHYEQLDRLARMLSKLIASVDNLKRHPKPFPSTTTHLTSEPTA